MSTPYQKLRARDVPDEPAGAMSAALPGAHDLLPGLLPALRSFLRRFMRSAGEANDIAQEAAVRALGAKEVPQDRAAYRAWLYRIARNAAIDAYRRRAAHAAEPDHVNPWGADRALITALSVRQALARLPHHQRRLLLLVDVEGLSYAEAARALDVPVGTVMSRVSRARAALLHIITQGERSE